jgi:hypothetical protein
MNILNSYSSHGLTDLKHANLMNRVDTKFMIPVHLLPTILDHLLPHYSALEIDNKRLFTYHNTYFDTDDYRFYHMHHQGKLNRYKVRHRQYVDTQTSFLEVKFKNNKGRTLKSRIPCDTLDTNESTSKLFLKTALGSSFAPLEPTQQGTYQRIALANEAEGERLTLDLNLNFQTADKQAYIQLPKFFIAELKQNKYNLRSPFALLMNSLGIRSSKFSKYCIGCSLITPSLKNNRFKPQLMAVSNFH